MKYLGGLAKNRLVKVSNRGENEGQIRLDELAASLPTSAFTPIQNREKKLKLFVAQMEVEISALEKIRNQAIIMNASTFEKAEDIDYFVTNVPGIIVTPQSLVETYSQTKKLEVFEREAKGWLGLKEEQVSDKTSQNRHFILVFCA